MTRAARMHKARERRNQALMAALADALENRLKDIPGWETFSPPERAVIGVCPYFTTRLEAVIYATGAENPSKWLENHSTRNPLFKAALGERRDSAAEILAQHEGRYHAGLSGLALFHVDKILSAPDRGPGRVTPHARLQAAKIVLRMNGLA